MRINSKIVLITLFIQIRKSLNGRKSSVFDIFTILLALRPHLHGRNEFVTMKNTFQAIMKDHGMRGLYRGIVPNMLKVVPACSISYLVYEQARNQMGL